MLMNFINRSKYTTWVLMPVIVGMLLTGVPPVTKAHAATYPITDPTDAKTWGLDSLGNLMRSGKFNSGKNVQKLRLNQDFKVPLPNNLMSFVENRDAALALGKALFWDMQVGSDGIQACATCHFQAGSDVRTKNQVSTQVNQVKYQRDGEIIGFYNAEKTDPGDPDKFETVYGLKWDTNWELIGDDFPLVITQNAFLPESPAPNAIIAADTTKGNRNDVVGSMGLMTGEFGSVTPGQPVDNIKDGTSRGNMRQTTGRNAPPAVNAVFNLFQFWDGRAHPKFNGFNPIGPLDQTSQKYFVYVNGQLRDRVLNMNNASLASQSVGPPLSSVEMSFAGRTWPDIGKKLTRNSAMTPLAYQEVSATDSVLGPYRNSTGKGLNKTYKELVQLAFKANLWKSTNTTVSFPQGKLVKTTPDEEIFIPGPHKFTRLAKAGDVTLPGEFTQMEANFALFFGIAVMLYEAELVTEQSRFDKWMEDPGNNPLSIEELDGLNVYVNAGKCIACHSGPEFTNATVRNTKNGAEQIEPVIKRNGDPAFYDNGFYNVGIAPTVDDIQRGGGNGTFPWGNSRQFLFEKNGIMDIPFSIMGLPIRNLVKRTVVDPDDGKTKMGLFKVDEATPDGFLVCYDLNGNGFCDLSDDIKIKTLDIDGNGKASSVRNVALNGPYFHNGDAATLQQMLDNYDIGGKFRTHSILNEVDMLPDITDLGLANKVGPNGTNAEEALVSFILALTDDRLRTEAQPFDHPQLFIPVDGTAPILDVTSGPGPAAWNTWLAGDSRFQELPATGAGGGADLKPFHVGLGFNPDPSNPNAGHFQGDTGKGSIP